MRKIPFAGIELTSQRVRGYMVPLSYRGDRLYREVEFCVLTIESFSTNYWAFVFGQNGQKRELPVLFWPKTGVPGNNSGRECWSYLIGQPPLPPDFGQKRPGTPGNSYFTQLPPVFGHLCSFLMMGYSTTRTDQHGPQEELNAMKKFCICSL